MSEPTLLVSRKRKGLAQEGARDEQEEVPRENKRRRICLREVVKTLSQWRIDEDQLVFFDTSVRSKGGSADIIKAITFNLKPTYLGRIRWKSEDVAVKKFRFSDDSTKKAVAACFANEVELLSGLSHENIIKFIGFVENTEMGVAWIVIPWEDNGNLREFVKLQDWVIPERLSLICDVARGVEYLHTSNPPICHGDLKSLNILVNSEHRAVITDFGSARKLDPNQRREKASGSVTPKLPAEHEAGLERERPFVQLGQGGTYITLTGPVFTLRWAAPELLAEDEFSLASDIWAFGWICWEIMTGSIPFDELARDAAIVRRVTRGDLPVIANNEQISQVRALCKMMTRCWEMNPEERPAAKECKDLLNWMNRIFPAKRNAKFPSEQYRPEVLCALGRTYIASGNNGAAARCFWKALGIARKAGNELVDAHASLGIGVTCAENQNHVHAEAWYTQAGEIFNRIGHQRGLANAKWGLGAAYQLQGKNEQARSHFVEARKIFDRIGDQQGVANAAWALGAVYRSMEEYTKAEQCFAESQEIFTRIADQRGVANSILGLGKVYRLRDKHAEAEDLYTEAREIYNRLGDKSGLETVLSSSAELQKKKRER